MLAGQIKRLVGEIQLDHLQREASIFDALRDGDL
jgi:hypothetical protein